MRSIFGGENRGIREVGLCLHAQLPARWEPAYLIKLYSAVEYR